MFASGDIFSGAVGSIFAQFLLLDLSPHIKDAREPSGRMTLAKTVIKGAGPSVTIAAVSTTSTCIFSPASAVPKNRARTVMPTAILVSAIRHSFCLLAKVTVPTVTLGCGVASPTLMTFPVFSRKSFASISSWLVGSGDGLVKKPRFCDSPRHSLTERRGSGDHRDSRVVG